MITTADVGVGVKGLEGNQAGRVSDYSIASFKFLRKLLLYYGKENRRKNCMFVLYNFYKNYILIFPKLWYGFRSGMTGLTLYENALLFQNYNIVFANFPIIIYGVIDEEFTKKFLHYNPLFYKRSKNSNKSTIYILI